MQKMAEVPTSEDAEMTSLDRTYQSQDYQADDPQTQTLLDALNDQRAQERLCDVILCTDDRKFPAHRCVLAATSPYFRSMFEEHHFVESKHKEIHLLSVCSEALDAILTMIYTSQLHLTLLSVHNVLSAADHLLLSNAKFFCADFMSGVLKSDVAHQHALRIWRSAELFSLTDLDYEAWRYVCSNFARIVETQSLTETTRYEMQKLLSSDEILEKDECVFWEAVLRWVSADPVERMNDFENLMEKIRFPLMDPRALLKKVQVQELMAKSEICQQYVEEAKRFQLLAASQSQMQSSRTKPRCTADQTLVYCLSGLDHFKCYVPLYDRWYSLASPGVSCPASKPPTTSRCCLLCVAGQVYLMVQLGRAHQVDHCELTHLKRYSVQTNSWSSCALPFHSTGASLVECSNTLYACSRDGIERYCPESDTWELVSGHGVEHAHFAVSHENCIYFYNLEEGVAQVIKVDRNFERSAQQMMTPARYSPEVLNVAKLPNQEVFISMRTLTGVSRKVFNVKSNLWRDANLYHSSAPIQPKPGQHYPSSLNLGDAWKVLCNRSTHALYVLGTRSGFADVPPKPRGREPVHTQMDAALPFFRFEFHGRTWHRVASLPENMSTAQLSLTISDGHSSMATRTNERI